MAKSTSDDGFEIFPETEIDEARLETETTLERVLKHENEDLKCENKRLISKTEELQKEIEHLKKLKQETESKCQDELFELQQTINALTKDIDKKKLKIANTEERKTEGKDSRQRDLDDAIKWKAKSYDLVALQLKETQDKLKDTEDELNATKSRLSKVMGDKLTDNNPNIADLSDNYRPTKLAERFQELYDNQWTDAFEIVDSKLGGHERTEKTTIAILIKILMETFKFCEEQANLQIVAIQEAIIAQPVPGKTDVPTIVKKQIKDFRRNVAVFTGEHVFQIYQDKLRNSHSAKASLAKNIPDFVTECFHICWLMTVQDPPMVFGPNVTKNETFDTDMYKAYTKSGRKIDFVVWPALLLHKNGPVLTKGIAQGVSERKSINNS